ncbi:MAG TPA: hypothetical protein VK826_13575 [Bacteroidia bacterium]|nr:hypothetical protein [Bacteroidia bacterium]
MKKLMLQSVAVAAVAFSLTITSCGNGTDTDTPVDTNDVDTGMVTTVIKDDIRVPSPGDIFEFMKLLGPETGDGNLLNPTDNEKKYTSTKSKAINLGVYSADLLYASTFDVKDKVLSYFGTSMRMGTALNVATGLSEKDKERISKNAGNADSLIAVGNDLYLSTFSNLESNQRGPELSLMLAGGWIEAMYLSCNMVKDFEKDKSVANMIAQQDVSLNNVIEYMTQHESNEDVASVLQQMKDLKVLFDAVSTTAGEAPKQVDGKRMKVGGGPQKNISKEQFDAIRKKIEEIRKGFVELT